MEAAFLVAAAAAERQVRPAGLELNYTRAVFIPSPAIRDRAEFSGVDSGKNLRAAAAARHSESSGPQHGATMRARTLPARSARPPHPSRAPLPTPTHARSSLSCAQTARVHDMTFVAQRWADGYSCTLRTLRACVGRHPKVEWRMSAYACRMFCAVFVPRGEHDERGWAM